MSSTQLDKLMLEMAALPKINQRVFDEYVLKCKAVLAQSGNDERNAREKKVQIKFLDSNVTMTCSTNTEITLKMMATIKQMAWCKVDGLTALPYEEWILKVPATPVACRVTQDLLRGAASARKLCILSL